MAKRKVACGTNEGTRLALQACLFGRHAMPRCHRHTCADHCDGRHERIRSQADGSPELLGGHRVQHDERDGRYRRPHKAKERETEGGVALVLLAHAVDAHERKHDCSGTHRNEDLGVQLYRLVRKTLQERPHVVAEDDLREVIVAQQRKDVVVVSYADFALIRDHRQQQ